MQQGVAQGIFLDGMGFSYGLMLAEWEKADDQEHALYMMMHGNANLKLPMQLSEVVSRWIGRCWCGPPALAPPSFTCKKIATLLDFVEFHGRAGNVDSFMRAIESFGAGVGQWLKVAADCKAEVVEASLWRRPSCKTEICAELGTFVGYTALRLARFCASRTVSAPSRVVSLEVDSIHALVTRHQLSLAQLMPFSEVWIGQALDLIPRLPEEFGCCTLTFTFMDHRGTKFHSDLWRLQRHGVMPPDATHVCDNTLKPGAPLCLWLAAYHPEKLDAQNWSLNEFAHWNSEDWMLVSRLG